MNNSSCKFKLKIPQKHINDILQDLLKKVEISGVLICDNNNNIVSVKKQQGHADSVSTDNNVVNFHTHPISAYNNADTIWGWPSGEDIRESIKFGLAGNKAHMVFTVEGVYTIQISPCKLKKMKEKLNDRERGVLIALIEEYFKCTHNFRGTDEVNNYNKKGVSINPYSWVDFINNFELRNILSEKSKLSTNIPHGTDLQSGHRFSKIPNVGFPETRNNGIYTYALSNYISNDIIHEVLRNISSTGDESELSKNISIKELLHSFKKILDTFDANICKSQWNNNPNLWFYVNFFPNMYYRTGLHKPPSTKEFNLLSISSEPYIIIFSDKSTGCSVNQISKTYDFGHKFGTPLLFGNRNSTFGRNKFGAKSVSEIPTSSELLRQSKDNIYYVYPINHQFHVTWGKNHPLHITFEPTKLHYNNRRIGKFYEDYKITNTKDLYGNLTKDIKDTMIQLYNKILKLISLRRNHPKWNYVKDKFDEYIWSIPLFDIPTSTPSTLSTLSTPSTEFYSPLKNLNQEEEEEVTSPLKRIIYGSRSPERPSSSPDSESGWENYEPEYSNSNSSITKLNSPFKRLLF